MTLTNSFATWGLSVTDIPESVRHSARRHILDAVGNAVAGQRTGAVDYVVDEAMTHTAPAASSIFGVKGRFSPPMAALANGTLIHALDFDDTHAGALIHGSAAILPAVLAASEERGGSFQDVVTSMIVGIEVAMRIGRLVPHGFHARGFHATSVVGIFGATLAAARLAGLDGPTTVNALGLAGSQAAGSLEFLETGSSTKQFHPGWAGLSALMAVRLAARGATGPDSILEGRYGLFKSYLGMDIDPLAALVGLNEEWETTKMTMKPYPVCQLSHATLDASRQVLGRVNPEEIKTIGITLPPQSIAVVAEPRDKKVHPRSAYEAKFSVQWDVAALMVDGHLGIEHFSSQHLERSQIIDLAKRVQVIETPYGGPPADAPGSVTITLDDGRQIEATVETSSGSPARPMSDAEIVEKFLRNAGDSLISPEVFAKAVLDGEIASASELFTTTEIR